MVSFLFWNLNGKPLQEVVTNLACQYDIDVIILAECSKPLEILKSLNQGEQSDYFYSPDIDCGKIEIFSRFSCEFITPVPVCDKNYLTIRHLKLAGLIDILLAAIHFPSKLYCSEDSQSAECMKLSDLIRDIENQVGHSRTILIGDLNMNPFENGVVCANGLHGVMSRRIAEKKARTVQGQKYPFFYNPMWNFFGDVTPGPPGTYFYSRPEQKVFFWNTYDQVLIRPELLPYFSNEDLEILISDGKQSLVTDKGLPDKNRASDHLPILFRIRI